MHRKGFSEIVSTCRRLWQQKAPAWKKRCAGKAPWAAGKPPLVKAQRWKGTLGRWKATAWKKWSAGKACWAAGKPPLGKSEELERHAGQLESLRLEKEERWKGTLGRWKTHPWKNGALETLWAAGKPPLRKSGPLERHPFWDFKTINKNGVGRTVPCQRLLALYGGILSKRGL